MSLQATTPPRPLPGDEDQTQLRLSSPEDIIETIALLGDMAFDDETGVSYWELGETDTEDWSLAEALKAAEVENYTLPEYLIAIDEAMEVIEMEIGDVALVDPRNMMDGPVPKKVFDQYADYLMQQSEEKEEMEGRFYSGCNSVEKSLESESAVNTCENWGDIIDSGFGTDWMELSMIADATLKSRLLWDGSEGTLWNIGDSEILEESAWNEMFDAGSVSSNQRRESFRQIESSTSSSDEDSEFVSVDMDINLLPAPLRMCGGQKAGTRRKRGSKRSEQKRRSATGSSFVSSGFRRNSKKSYSRKPYGSEGYKFGDDGVIYYCYDFIFREGIRRSQQVKNDGVEKPFCCPVPDCDRTYKNANGLKYHAQYGHSPKQMFVCDICHKTYGTKHGLNAHKKAHVKKSDAS